MIRTLGGDALEADQSKRCEGGNHRFTLELPVAFKRRGVETKIVLPQTGTQTNAPDENLIQAVALGHKWFAEIKDGEVSSISELGARHGVNQGDVSRVVRLGLLAPDIVESIRCGRHPTELTAARLKRVGDLPVC